MSAPYDATRYFTGIPVVEPTGYGLPGFDESVFSVAAALPELADETWCECGCPIRDCIDADCKEQACRAS